MGKIKGIEVTDLRVGTGAEATQNDCVAVNIRMFLRRGEEVHFSPALGPRMVINLARRDSIAGLLKGLPGMRVGGLRQIVISPHLAYGEAGIPGRIPPNALLRCEVELVALREHSAILPEVLSPIPACFAQAYSQPSALQSHCFPVPVIRPSPFQGALAIANLALLWMATTSREWPGFWLLTKTGFSNFTRYRVLIWSRPHSSLNPAPQAVPLIPAFCYRIPDTEYNRDLCRTPQS